MEEYDMFFRNEYFFLSNFYGSPITIKIADHTYTFRNAEAAFQACKCPERAGEFVHLSGKEAKRLGRRVLLRSGWNDIRIPVMQGILAAKFGQNPDLMEKLLSVKGPITEENTWGDTFWGICNGKGENHLGKLLTELRDAQ